MSSLPQTLGQYQVIREIARSNDVVYEGYDPVMCRRVAIKELAIPRGSSSTQEKDRIERFKREAQAAGGLSHPNIMTVYGFSEEGDHTFMAMEFLDGRTLRNELDTKGALAQDKAVEIIAQVLAGLEHAHSKGVIHRDIKPENIQLTTSGTVKITDFGIARLTFQPNLTQDGQVFGTPSYMSPEQIQGREIDARSDLFSSAVMFYEMLSGTKPFIGDSIIAITHSILNGQPNQLTNVPYSLWQVLEKGMDKSPVIRYSSASEFSAAIERATTIGYDMVVPDMGSYGSGYGQGYSNIPAPPVIQPPQMFMPAQAAPTPVGQQVPIGQPIYQPYGMPYQGQQMGGYAPMQPQVYYPAPPRAPMVRPETVDFYKRLLLTFLIVGTLFALVIVAVFALSSAYKRAAEQRHDSSIQAGAAQTPGLSTSSQIHNLRAARNEMQSSDDKTQVDQQLAALYEHEGLADTQRGAYADAEAAYQSAIKADSYNPTYDNELAQLYWNEGRAGETTGEQAPLFGKAGDEWLQAAIKETDTSLAKKYRAWSVDAYSYYTNAIIGTDDPSQFSGARDRLRTAKSELQDQPELAGELNDLIQKLS